MKFAYPIKASTAEEVYRNNERAEGGFFPCACSGLPHRGTHFHGTESSGVYAIADGELIAYRITRKYDNLSVNGLLTPISTCFILLKHTFPRSKYGDEITFFSLYMHLLPWEKYGDKIAPSFFHKTIYTVKADQNNRNGCGLRLFSRKNGAKENIIGVIPYRARVNIKKDSDGNIIKKDKDGWWEVDAPIGEGRKTGFIWDDKYSYTTRRGDQLVIKVKPHEPIEKEHYGLNVYRNSSETSEVLWVIPNGTTVEFEDAFNLGSETKELKQLSVEKYGDKAGFIKIKKASKHNLATKQEKYVEADKIMTNPQKDGQPIWVKAGQLLGYVGDVDRQKNFVHVEVFTGSDDFMKFEANKEKPVTIYRAAAGAKFAKQLKPKVLMKDVNTDIWFVSPGGYNSSTPPENGTPFELQVAYRKLWLEITDHVKKSGKVYKLKNCPATAYIDCPSSDNPSPESIPIQAVPWISFTVKEKSVGNKKYFQGIFQVGSNAKTRGWVLYNEKTLNMIEGDNYCQFQARTGKTEVLYETSPGVFTLEDKPYTIETKQFIEPKDVVFDREKDPQYMGTRKLKDGDDIYWYKIDKNDKDPKFRAIDYWDWKRFFTSLVLDGQGSDKVTLTLSDIAPVSLKLNADDTVCQINKVTQRIDALKKAAGDRELIGADMVKAIRHPSIAQYMRTFVVKGPSEWVSVSNTPNLKEGLQKLWNLNDEDFKEVETIYEKLKWYDDPAVKECNLPDYKKLFYFHPVAFVQHLKRLFPNEYYAEYTDESLTIHTPEGSTTYEINEYDLVRFPESGRGVSRYGQGYTDTYSIPDMPEKGNGAHGDNWVTPKFAAAVYNAVQEYIDSNPNYSNDIPLCYNDFSAYDPEVNLGHTTHDAGNDVDCRYMDSNGQPTNNAQNADVNRMKEFVKKLKEKGCTRIYSDGGNSFIEGTTNASGHSDHLHAGWAS